MAEKLNLTGSDLDFCARLRTKRYYVSDAPPVEYMTEDVSETGYWCLKTMGVFGPDDDYVCPTTCGTHRSCYKSRMGNLV